LYEQHDFIEVVGRRREAVFKCNWKEMHWWCVLRNLTN
jgi:hypothetical protein